MYKVYELREHGESVYIGITGRPLAERLKDHLKNGNAMSHTSILEILSVEKKGEALRKETHIISLIGLKRLRNKVTRQGRKDGTHCSEEYKKMLSLRLTGVKKNPDLKDAALKKLGLRYFELYQNEKYIGRFINQTRAAAAVGLPKSTFVNILKGIRIKTKGIEVKYV